MAVVFVGMIYPNPFILFEDYCSISICLRENKKTWYVFSLEFAHLLAAIMNVLTELGGARTFSTAISVVSHM